MATNSTTTGDVWHEALSFFDPGGSPSGSLIDLQVDPTAPVPTGTQTTSDPLLASIPLADRLAHFPANLYDLRETSHLYRFMAALLGDSGGGGLRKTSTVVRFQNTLQGTHFYDLDRFYGAIFGATRNLDEILTVDTSTSTATTEEWDQTSVSDSSYRQRVFNLAAAINMGATYPGIQSAAEALIQTDVDLYEAWELLDAYGPGGPGRDFDDLEALGAWDAIEALDDGPDRPTWEEVSDVTTVGRTGTNSRAEIIVVPKKNYDQVAAEQGQDEADRQRLEDEHSLIRVLKVLKPASTLLTVDSSGIALHTEASITNLHADSNFWYISTQVVPNPALISPTGAAYPTSIQQAVEGVLSSSTHEIPKPPWSIQQEARWSYAPEVNAVRVYTVDGNWQKAFVINGQDSAGGVSPGILDGTDYATLTYQDDTRESFTGDRAILDPRRALAARYAAAGILVTSTSGALSRATGASSLLEAMSDIQAVQTVSGSNS